MNLIPPPSGGVFETVDQAIQAFNCHAAPQGYAIIIFRSQKRNGQPYRVNLGCDRSRTPKIDGHVRKTSTRGTNCPFRLTLKALGGNWTADLRHGGHNHPPSDPLAHPAHRRVSAAGIQRIRELSEADIAPRDILSALRASEDEVLSPTGTPPIARDVRNVRAQLRSTQLGPYTPIQALIVQLDTPDWFCSYNTDPEGRISQLFIASRLRSTPLLRAAPEILIMDCTYNTNVHKMPLFTVVGLTSFGSTFHVAFAFLSQERQSDYEWVLRQLRALYESIDLALPVTLFTDRDRGLMVACRTVFPAAINVLCLWHVEKAIVAYIPRKLRGNDCRAELLGLWNAVLFAATPEAYEIARSALRDRFAGDPGGARVLNYLASTWLRHKEALIKNWTNQALTLGLSTTSRVEGPHAALKQRLGNATGHMHVVFQKICSLLEHREIEIRAEIENRRTSLAGRHRIALFAHVVAEISPIALDRVLAEKRRLEDPPLALCTRAFTTSQGLPCAHVLETLTLTGAALQLDDFHPFWRFDRLAGPLIAIDPVLLALRDPPRATP